MKIRTLIIGAALALIAGASAFAQTPSTQLILPASPALSCNGGPCTIAAPGPIDVCSGDCMNYKPMPGLVIKTDDSIITSSAVSPTWGDALAPFAPYLVAGIAGLLIAILGWATALFQRWTGYQLTAEQRAALHSAAQTAAGKIWAAADTAIGQQKITIGDSRLQSGVDWVLKTGAPDAVKSLNISPDQVESLIVAKLGQMQANSPSAPGAAS